MITIYHNPRCQKSRQTLNLIEESGKKHEIVLYLNDIPTQKKLKELLKLLGLKAEQLVRKGEPIYKEKYKGQSLTEAAWVKAMVENPKLIERPIVVKGKKAIIGRPPELVKTLL